MAYKKFGKEKSKLRRKMKNAIKKTGKKKQWAKKNSTGVREEYKIWLKAKQKSL